MAAPDANPLLPVLQPGLALIFDMDGVVVDSNPVHVAAWMQYLQRYNRQVDQLEERMVGRRNDQLMEELLGTRLTTDEIAAHGAAKEALYRELMAPQLESRLLPGVREFLDRYRDFPIGLATNAEAANVEFLFGAGNLRTYFRSWLDGSQVRNPKPDPEIYLKVAALLGVDPANCIVFEDSRTGIEAALASGARVVGVEPDRQPPIATDFAIANFQDPSLPLWLASLTPRA